MDERNRQLFILPQEIVDALNLTEVMFTARQMVEMGIFHPPVLKFDVKLTGEIEKISYWLYDRDNEDIKSMVKRFGVSGQTKTLCMRFDFTGDNFSYLTGISYDGEKEVVYVTNKEHYDLKRNLLEGALGRDVSYEEFVKSEDGSALRFLRSEEHTSELQSH